MVRQCGSSRNKKDGVYTPILYSQVKSDMDELGTALIDLGLKNEKIAIIGENRYEWANSYLAVVSRSRCCGPA